MNIMSQGMPPGLVQMALEGVGIYCPLFVIAFAGIISGKEKFNNQLALLDEVLHPRNWNRSGSTTIVELPQAVAFVYQAVHGAVCLLTDQLSLAVNLVKARIEASVKDGSLPLYLVPHIIGWPYTLGGNSKIAWDFLWQLPEEWSWLAEIFGHPDDFRIALCSYHMALNILELADTIARGNERVLEGDSRRLDVPIRFPAMERDVVRRGYRLLLRDVAQVKSIWEKLGVSEQVMKNLWPKWMSYVSRVVAHEYFASSIEMPHRSLFQDL